jgi:hypothetical protein
MAVQVFLCRGVLAGELPTYRDLSRLFIPLKAHVAAEFSQGRLPQWWPWEALGMPLAGQPMASLFHPTTLLFLLLPFRSAFAAQWFLPLPLAAYGTWRVGRALGLDTWSATLAGAAYSLGGYFLSATEFTFSSLAAAALPFVALGALRTRTLSHRLGWLAGSMALLLLAGDPVLAYLAGATALCFAARRGSTPVVARRLGWFAAAMVLAAALAAIQLVPTARLFLESSRSHGTVHGSMWWSLGRRELWGFLIPSDGSGPEFLYRSTFLGGMTVTLAVLGAAVKGRARVALLVVAAWSIALSVGEALPLWKWAAAVLPGWHAFRFPAKAMGPFTLSVALLAGRGTRAVGIWFRRRQVRPLLLVVATLELAFFNGFIMKTEKPAPPPPLASTLSNLGVSLEGWSYVWHWRLPRGAPECTRCEVATLAPASGSLHGLPTSNAYVPGFSAEYGELNVYSMWTWLGPLAPLFGSRYQIGTRDEVGNVVARDEAAGALVVDLPGALPRAYLATGVIRAPRSEVPTLLHSPRFKPGEEVVLTDDEGNVAAVPPEREPSGPMVPASVHRDGAAVEVKAVATTPSVLVLNESFFRGVRAFEADHEVPVFRVNHLVRGVQLEPGEHTIRFEYETPGLKLGVTLSLATLVACALWAARTAAVRRRMRNAVPRT